MVNIMKDRDLNQMTPPSVHTVRFLPDDFTNKTKHEPFTQTLMKIVLEKKQWRPGNANKGEPDYFCENTPFEFTLASNEKKKGNYIQKLKRGEYTTNDLEPEVLEYIRKSIEKKIQKKYSVSNVHLCVLCLINMTFWVLDEYGSVLEDSSTTNREELFDWITKNCLDTNKFKNVFIIFPDLCANWWVWDVKTTKKSRVHLSDKDILSQKVPFWLFADVYDKIAPKA